MENFINSSCYNSPLQMYIEIAKQILVKPLYTRFYENTIAFSSTLIDSYLQGGGGRGVEGFVVGLQ
jgi:hypothetical protein